MDNLVLKKKLSTFVSEKGQLRNVTEEVLYEVLVAWENWTGTAREFYRAVGFSQWQMATIIGKAKKLKREGYYGEGEFKQITVEGAAVPANEGPCSGVEIVWNNGRIIRFSEVDLLIDFLKKTA